jgi:hypothetical protein
MRHTPPFSASKNTLHPRALGFGVPQLFSIGANPLHPRALGFGNVNRGTSTSHFRKNAPFFTFPNR